MIGLRGGGLVVTGHAHGRMWHCTCECGRTTTVRIDHIRSGETRSCGCLRGRANRDRLLTHGATGTRLYNIYTKILGRCLCVTDRAYRNYGGRGISVCQKWQDSYLSFAKDVGEPPAGMSIDRIDNNRGYEPGNVRWATPVMQMRNYRGNRVVTAFGESKPVSAWSEDPRCAVPYSAFRNRIAKGWPAERALTHPVRSMRPYVRRSSNGRKSLIVQAAAQDCARSEMHEREGQQ